METKTAKEMFEELGYEQTMGFTYDGYKTITYKQNVEQERPLEYTRLANIINFNLKYENEIHIEEWNGISIDVLKAINQQCKELRWLDEL